MPKLIHTEIEIAASAAQVWAVLTDFDAYPEWNPFITQINGRPEIATRLDATLQPSGGKAMRFRPSVLEAKPASELRWLGHLLMPGLFDGEHSFKIEPLGPNRVRFVQEEVFSGILSSLVLRFAGDATKRGFEAMNVALKDRAEQLATSAAA